MVFVSYKRADMDKVFPLVHKMESELGFKFWIDLEGIESDEQFTNVIINAIIDCEVFLFMFSKSHENIDPRKDWTVSELNFANEKKKRIIWVELEDCKLHNWFIFKFPDKQVVKASNELAMRKLIEDIRKFLHLPNNIQEQPSDTSHPQAIDLGLPSGTKWASWNVGASKPEEYGGYYAWGETEEKNYYYWDTYIHCDGSSSTCHELGRDIAGTKHDVAHMKWGGDWRMPTLVQFKELLANCLQEKTTLNGVKGFKLTSKLNGNSIFLPAAGLRRKDDIDHAGSYGEFWLSSQDPSVPDYAYSFRFRSGYAYRRYDGRRSDGITVRPVSR